MAYPPELKTDIETPYYLIDEGKLLKNMETIRLIKERSGAKFVLALKCFASWCVFDLMSQTMDGTTSSSLYETRLGHEKFGKEVHAYSVAYSDEDIRELKEYSDKIIFNSIDQLKAFHSQVRHLKVGLRINPQFSYSNFDLANPARKHSKLGANNFRSIMEAADLISGAMFHYNCENDDFDNFSSLLDKLGDQYGPLLSRLEWVSLGGGIYFTKEHYPVEKFCRKIKEFSKRFNVQVYLEPGEAAITNTTTFVTKVLDIVHNELEVAIVDSSVEAHMLDLLIYGSSAKMANSKNGEYRYMIAGRSCLAGDIFGTFNFESKLKVGSVIRFEDAAGYTMVKKNWFNGLKMPSIVVKKVNGDINIVKTFSYNDFKENLS